MLLCALYEQMCVIILYLWVWYVVKYMNIFCSPHKDGSISTKHQSACVWSNIIMMTKLKRGLVIHCAHCTCRLFRFWNTLCVTWNVPVLSGTSWHRLNWKACVSDLLFSQYFTFYVFFLFLYVLLFVLKGVDVIPQPENWKFGDSNRMNMPEFIHYVCICWHLFLSVLQLSSIEYGLEKRLAKWRL